MKLRGLLAPLTLVAARARRRPGRWLLPALGIALAVAFAGGVAAEATIAGDQSARAVLNDLPPQDSTVRVTWQGMVTSAVGQQARQLLGSLGLGPQTEVVLLNPVRLSGTVVRPAAIAPLDRWILGAQARALGPCRPSGCPMLVAGARLTQRMLAAPNVRIPLAGVVPLASAVPLGFAATATPPGQPPLLLSEDPSGLESLAGLSGIYRTHSWVAPVSTGALHSWQVRALERRLQLAQARLLASGSQFSLAAPFNGLDQARSQASAAPRRLLLAGGGAVAALALFVVLAAGGLRRDQREELSRMEVAGAKASQCLVFVVGESAWLCGAALIAGAALALISAAVLSSAAGVPTGGVLTHSLLTPAAALAACAGWLAATALTAVSVLGSTGRLADLLGACAAAALALALARGAGGDDPLPVLLAPLCCLAAGVLTARAAALLLRGGERLARRGPVLPRLALVDLARSPGSPSLAIAFIAVSIGLGGFALAYRATLLRSAADQAAHQVPLDATAAPGANFRTPLEVASLARWSTIARGGVLPVRRTEATYASGGGTVTVPTLGIPSSGLPLIHGWRASDGSAPLSSLAHRLRPPGATRAPGPRLPPTASRLSLRVSSPALDVSITADLRDGAGDVRQLHLGSALPRPEVLGARIPPGRWELEALELAEPTGLEITNGHQNGENPAAATQSSVRVALGAPLVQGPRGQALARVPLGGWRAVGAAAPAIGGSSGRGEAVVRFSESGLSGVLRPAQPSDTRPVPVLADPQTAASSARDGRLALTVDGLVVRAQVVGVARRFPTVGAGAAGFLVADEPTLASALDAQLPGQGRPDELWISTSHSGPLRAALTDSPFSQLSASFRSDIERRLRAAPIARGVLGTLVAATAVAGVLAILGLLAALFGPARDRRVERDLEEQGMGPRGLRDELRARLVLIAAFGVCVGGALALALTLLAVAVVRAGTVAVPEPPVVTVAPWLGLIGWMLAAIAALGVTSWIASRSVGR